VQRQDYTTEAEALFRAFAARHSLVIKKIESRDIELLMSVPEQSGLSFELTLGLQNKDELNIGFEGFWSYFFPFEKTRDLVDSALDGIVSGRCRLAIHDQFGRAVKRVLEQYAGGSWIEIYGAYSFIKVPFVGTKISYVRNAHAREMPHSEA
jgi:hypothetical protein